MRVSRVPLLVLAVLVAACACSDNRSSPVPTQSPGEQSGRPSATATAPPTPPAAPVRHTIPEGGELPSDYGLLYIDLQTGEMTFWEMPGAYTARMISADGRWVVWGADGASGTHFLDTLSGRDGELTLDGEPAGVTGISPEGKLLVAVSLTQVALLQLAELTPLAEAERPDGGANGAADFSSHGAAALAFGGERVTPSVLILGPGGSTATIDGATWPIRWSHDGTRLAVTTTEATRIVGAQGDVVLDIPFAHPEAGSNLRWSPDDRYLAVANPYDVGGQRVFDTTTGAEVLRTVGTPTCIGEQWFDDGTLAYGWIAQRMSVPAGEVVGEAPPPPDPGFEFGDPGIVPGTTRLILDAGPVVSFRTEASWSVPFDADGIHPVTTSGEALFLIGIGGRGICDGDLPQPAVDTPPFDD